MANLIVTSGQFKWPQEIRGVPVVSAQEYLTNPVYSKKRYRVYNLCHTYKYQGVGYYVSLLGEARGHKVLPNVKTITEFSSAVITRIAGSELEHLWQKLLEPIRHDQFELSIYFGKNLALRYEKLAGALFNLFPAPLLRAQFVRVRERWQIKSVGAISMRHVPDDHWPYVIDYAKFYFSRDNRIQPRKKIRYDLALLLNPGESEPPSGKEAIEKFTRAFERFEIGVDIIDKTSFGKLAEYDALFIRETTAVNHHTFRFAQRAQVEGMVVIDDPLSIIRCTNKVYLAELLKKNRINIPRTQIVSKDNFEELAVSTQFPIILKKPDSSFSQGVVRADDHKQYLAKARELLVGSDLIILQEYMPTEFDWRIGFIDGREIYAAKYFMASKHWQIMNWKSQGRSRYGNTQAFALEEVPHDVIETARAAAHLIGDGLYGVDLKVHNGECYIIEVNDNPSIDAGVEDKVYGKKLYEAIALSFFHRLENQ